MVFHYRTYTIADLREWLLYNKENGLSHNVINRSRAFAFINNPCARDEDTVLAVVFNDHNQAIGYTAAFADDYVEGNIQGRFFWGSTEWLSPEYRGKGIASRMMDAIKQAVGYHRYLGLASSESSVKLDLRQGSRVNYYPQYSLVIRSTKSLKSRLSTLYTYIKNRRLKYRIGVFSYEERVINYVDNETYLFICLHSGKDLFLRSQAMLNWLLRFPFLQTVFDQHHLEQESYDFKSYVNEYDMFAVQVRVDGILVGYYVVSQVDKVCVVRYLYYEDGFSDEVFASVSSCLLRSGIDVIRFFDSKLYAFLRRKGFRSLNTRDIYRQISFTTPGDFDYDHSLSIQGGDGDMLT